MKHQPRRDNVKAIEGDVCLRTFPLFVSHSMRSPSAIDVVGVFAADRVHGYTLYSASETVAFECDVLTVCRRFGANLLRRGVALVFNAACIDSLCSRILKVEVVVRPSLCRPRQFDCRSPVSICCYKSYTQPVTFTQSIVIVNRTPMKLRVLIFPQLPVGQRGRWLCQLTTAYSYFNSTRAYLQALVLDTDGKHTNNI